MEELLKQIKDAMPALKAKAYRPECVADVTDAEMFGKIMSKYFLFDGDDILEAAGSALEDANYHDEAATVRAL